MVKRDLQRVKRELQSVKRDLQSTDLFILLLQPFVQRVDYCVGLCLDVEGLLCTGLLQILHLL